MHEISGLLSLLKDNLEWEKKLAPFQGRDTLSLESYNTAQCDQYPRDSWMVDLPTSFLNARKRFTYSNNSKAEFLKVQSGVTYGYRPRIWTRPKSKVESQGRRMTDGWSPTDWWALLRRSRVLQYWRENVMICLDTSLWLSSECWEHLGRMLCGYWKFGRL